MTVRDDAAAGRRTVGAACGLMSAAAVAGAVGLAKGEIDLGPTITSRLPLHSPRLGGIALAGLVALPMGAAAVAGGRRSPRTGNLSLIHI